MSALDEVAKLKERRRAELAEAEERSRAAEAERTRVSVEAFRLGVLAVLREDGAEWLAEFQKPELERVLTENSSVSACFEVPGHRAIFLGMHRFESASELRWVAARSLGDDESRPWSAFAKGLHGQHFEAVDTLADALIAAEIEGWAPPAPPASEPLSDEEMFAARAAWRSMTLADPMPVGIGVDLVQNHVLGSDRARASHALHQAAAEWLDRLRPEQPVEPEANEYYSAAVSLAGMCQLQLAQGQYDPAYESCVELDRISAFREAMYRSGDVQIQEALASSVWLGWCISARVAIDLCRAVSAAAQPAEAA